MSRDGDRHLRLVLAGEEVRRVRSRACEHLGVPALETKVSRIVEAATEVRTVEVVRGVREPLRNEEILSLVEVHGDHLPVRLVVVDAVEPRAPVVARIEEPVLADRPPGVAHDPPVVHVAVLLGSERGVLELGRR